MQGAELSGTRRPGLWILDQVDPNRAALVRSEDGSEMREIQTESIHGSGIALWIDSTNTSDGTPPKTMKVDPKTGKTLKQWVTPESGIWTKGPNATYSGAHCIKLVNNQYRMAVPASGKL